MLSIPIRAATARARARVATLGAVLIVVAGLPQPAGAWPFASAKPSVSPSSVSPSSGSPSAVATPAKAAAARKATAEERAAADRLDPLARSAFWAREVDLDSTDVQAGVQLAVSLRLLGHYPEALETVGRVLVIDPKNLDALLESARDDIGENRGFYAIEPLKQAIVLAPHDWRPLSLMGVAREQNQQPDDAHAAFNQALQLSPENPAVMSNLALWCATHGDHAQAETLLRRAVGLPRSSAQERQNLALLLGMEGRMTDAERLMREDLPPEIADNNLAYLRAVAGVAR